MNQLAHAIQPGSVIVGNVVRLGTDPNKVPLAWHDVMAEITTVDMVDVDGDSLVVRSACGVTIAVSNEDVYKLDAIERLAWVSWKDDVGTLRERVEGFKRQRNRENEWVQNDEVVRISDESYVDQIDMLFAGARIHGHPLNPLDLEWADEQMWATRTSWRTARVTRTPKREGESFSATILEEENDYVTSTVGKEIDVEWVQVFRIETTPENE